MFGLQKQRRNAAGAWFIAGHLTVFAKLSHHAVPLESRIFSSWCFSFSAPPLSPLPLPSRLVRTPYRRLLHISPSSLLRYHPTKTTRISVTILRDLTTSCGRFAVDFWISMTEKVQMDARTRRCLNSFIHVYILHITSIVDVRKNERQYTYLFIICFHL